MTAGGDAGGRTRIALVTGRPEAWSEEDHQLAKQSSRLNAVQAIRWKPCQRWTAICLPAYIYTAIAVAVQRRREAGSDLDGLIPITVPELLRLLRDAVIPPSRRDQPTGFHSAGGSRRPPQQARSREPVSVEELR